MRQDIAAARVPSRCRGRATTSRTRRGRTRACSGATRQRSDDVLLTRFDAAALVPVVRGRQLLVVHVERAIDIVNLIALRREFPALRMAIAGASEGWTVARELAASGMWVFAEPLSDLPVELRAAGRDAEQYRAHARRRGQGGDRPARRHALRPQRAPVRRAISSRLRGVPGASAVSWGEALAMITSRPAEAIGMGGEFGRLSAGYRADVVLWSGDPLENSSVAEAVWIDGVRAADRQPPDQAARPLSRARPPRPARGLSQVSRARAARTRLGRPFVGTHFAAVASAARGSGRARWVSAVSCWLYVAGRRWRPSTGWHASLRAGLGAGAASRCGAGNFAVWIAATLLMWVGSVLFVGSLRRNPALPTGRAPVSVDRRAARGVRHHPPPDELGLRAVGGRPCPRQCDPGVADRQRHDPDPRARRVGWAGHQENETASARRGVEWRRGTAFVPFGKGFALPDALRADRRHAPVAWRNLCPWRPRLSPRRGLGLFRLTLFGQDTRMGRKFFGTDGIRGRTNQAPMTAETALRVGQAAGTHFLRGDHRHRVVIGKDTRLSGYMMELAMVAGFTSVGMDVILLGPLPTPAIAMLTKELRADLGRDDLRQPQSVRGQWHQIVRPRRLQAVRRRRICDRGVARGQADAGRRHRRSAAPSGSTMRAGATSISPSRPCPTISASTGSRSWSIAPMARPTRSRPRRCGNWAPTSSRSARAPMAPTSTSGCGSTAPAALQETVVASGAQIGLALDGDADRLIVVDETGRLVDGDQLMALIALTQMRRGTLKGGGGGRDGDVQPRARAQTRWARGWRCTAPRSATAMCSRKCARRGAMSAASSRGISS